MSNNATWRVARRDIRVVAPCRLHFGLFHVPVEGLMHAADSRPVRKFGGLGLMIEKPNVIVEEARHIIWQSRGNLAERSTTFRQSVWQARAECQYALHRARILAEGPPEHIGLGVGTALGLASARAELIVFTGRDEPAEALAEIVGRGKRSGIGVHGFESGGFIADDGKLEDELPKLGARVDFPDEWRVVLARPPIASAWFGDRERTAFARARPAERALALATYLRTLAYHAVVPSVRKADFDTFTTSIAEFNRLAGEPFRDDQGGPYASPEVACVIDELMEMGGAGVGQSSWGPTVFAFAQNEDAAQHLAEKARRRFSAATEITVTAANNRGAVVTELGSDEAT